MSYPSVLVEEMKISIFVFALILMKMKNEKDPSWNEIPLFVPLLQKMER